MCSDRNKNYYEHHGVFNGRRHYYQVSAVMANGHETRIGLPGGVPSTPLRGCPAGQASCGGVCVNLENDAANCGYCGDICRSGETCSAGLCRSSAGPVSAAACPQPDSMTQCGISCLELLWDESNCGVCGNRCGAGQVCEVGYCVPSNDGVCPAPAPGDGPLERCNSKSLCVYTSIDRNNCGFCGNVCPSNKVCEQGSCVEVNCPADEPIYCPAQVLRSGGGTFYVRYEGHCANTFNSDTDCGACGNPCYNGTSCYNGTCQASQCPAGNTMCPSGCSTLVDNQNCGACGKACAVNERCEGDYDLFNVRCVAAAKPAPAPAPTPAPAPAPVSCQAGLTLCGGSCVNTYSDRNNCGACGNICPATSPGCVGKCIVL